MIHAPSNRALAALIVLCVSLGGVVARLLHDLTDTAPVTLDGSSSEQRPAAQGTDLLSLPPLPPLSDYQAILAHPLFDRARGAAPAAAAESTAPEPAVVVKPVAVVTSPDHNLVLLQIADTPRLVKAEIGEEIEGWLVLDITPKQVTLQGSDGAVQVHDIAPNKGIGLGEPPSVTTDQPSGLYQSTKETPNEAAKTPEEPTEPPEEPPPAPEDALPTWTPDALEKLVTDLAGTGNR